MRNTKQSIALVASGVMLGTAIAAPAATAALTAQQSSQKIVVDGKPVQIEAYAINGNNYCKLRDIGKAVGFDVSYDAVSNTVHIRTAPAVQLPTDGSQYVPQIGDRILCDDGTEYEIKDVERWKSIPLPTPTCDWNAFPTLTLPEPVVKHYSDKYGDDLFVRNVFEVRRMVYTIYNALGEEPDAWRDGKPLCKIYTEIPLEYEPYTSEFWPWSEEQIAAVVHTAPNVRYYVDAYDYYHDGAYVCTRYLLMMI